MSTGVTLAEDTFEKLGTSQSANRDIGRNLQSIGEEILTALPGWIPEGELELGTCRVSSQYSSEPRDHMWLMFSPKSDKGTPQLPHSELLVSEDDDGPYAVIRFNALQRCAADERERIADRLQERPEDFLNYVGKLDDYFIEYKAFRRNEVNKDVSKLTLEEVIDLGETGITNLNIYRKYRPQDGIFTRDFVESAKDKFRDVFLPLLAEYTFEDRIIKEEIGDGDDELVDDEEVSYFVLKTGSDKYQDIPKEVYHFKEGIQGSNQIREPDRVKFVYLEDGSFYAKGEISHITSEEQEGVIHYFAEIDNYEEIEGVDIDEMEDQISPEFPKQYGIIKITEQDYKLLTGHADEHEHKKTDSSGWRLGDVDFVKPDFETDPSDIELKGLYFENEEELLRDILSSLRRGNHLLFVGPPGTGKSKLASQVASELVGNSYELTTATADWSTFDTIGGYRQQRNGHLEFRPGLFLSRFQDENGTPTNEWLIVDEFNRANIDKAFGSLFSVLAHDDVVLPFTDEFDRDIVVYGSDLDESKTIHSNHYVVPRDWRLLATMNTFDKSSLYDLSYALSRRFGYIHIPAPPEETIDRDLVESYVECWEGVDPEESEIEDIVVLWRTIQVERPLGPALMKDVLSAANGDFTAGVIQHILPQFEGLMNSTQETILQRIAETGLVENDALELFGRQYFELPNLEL